MSSRGRKWLIIGGLLIVIGAAGAYFWVRRFRDYTPVEALRDLEAAAQTPGSDRPVERFLEIRYGSLNVSSHRQEALRDFFNVGHIEGLFIIVGGLPAAVKRQHVASMAQWIADYRRTMTPEEKQSLKVYFQSEKGQARVRQATSNYLSKDWRFRAETAPVIQELMATLAALQQP